jgi:drug/metabolite transporter (DMT)-like permease
MGQSSDLRGYAQAATAMTIVGALTAVSATIARYPVYGGQAMRYAVAALILFGVARLRGGGVRPTRGQWGLIVGLAATGLAGFNICIIEGTRYTSPATIGTVIGATPIVVAVAAPLMDGRRPAPRVVVAAAVVAAGAGVANGLGARSLPGFLLALGAMAGEVCFSLLAVPLLPKLGAVRVSAYSSAAAVPMLLVAGVRVDGRSVVRVPTLGETAGLAYLALVVTAAAFIVWYDALGRIGADRASLFAGLIPVSAAVTTLVLGLRPPHMADLAGALIVGCGVAAGLRRSADRPLLVAAAPDHHDPADDEGGHDQHADHEQNPVDRGRVAEQAAEHGR